MKGVFKTTNLKRYQFPTHINDLVYDRTEATCSEAFVVVLKPGTAPPLHTHDDAEQVYYVLSGSGTLTRGEEKETCELVQGDVVIIPPNTPHTVKADKEEMRYLAIDCFTSIENRPEPTWDIHVQALCKKLGWDFDEVIKDQK